MYFNFIISIVDRAKLTFIMEWWNDGVARVFKLSNGGMAGLVELPNRQIVEGWNGGVVEASKRESSDGRMVE